MSEEIDSEIVRKAISQVKRNQTKLASTIGKLIHDFEKENGIRIADLSWDVELEQVDIGIFLSTDPNAKGISLKP